MNKFKTLKSFLGALALSLFPIIGAQAQNNDVAWQQRHVWQAFSLSEVRLSDGCFNDAMQRHRDYVLSLNVDRLIPHVLRQAGLQPKGENYGGWEKGGGCTWGHYMSSCAMFFASTGDERFLSRLHYLIGELKRCRDNNPDGWWLRKDIKRALQELRDGRMVLTNPDETGQPWNFNNIGNVWYSIHKILAGLRDVWLYTNDKDAFSLWEGLSRHIAECVMHSNSDLVQAMLSVEQGGMAEVMADMYEATADTLYSKCAARFNHINVIYPTANGDDVLCGRHANDQIPKFVGVAKQYEYSGDELLCRAAKAFWNLVVHHHSLAIGGNSCYERFGIADDEVKRLDFSSAETCNTYNMLKLSRQLFMLTGEKKYLDYYEWALYNHILASQDPCHEGSVTYYTTLTPGGFKQYSTPYDSFWCCVGTGLENHAKYGGNIYFHNSSEILVNLFIASSLCSREMGLRMHIDTNFPFDDKVSVIIDEAGSFDGTLKIRIPEWCRQTMTATCNGKTVNTTAQSDFVSISGIKTGDRIDLTLPMRLGVRNASGEPHYGTFTYGPLVLAGNLGTKDMPSDIVSDNRALRSARFDGNLPEFAGNLADMASWIKPLKDTPLHFSAKSTDGRNIEFMPYFQMHHKRNSVYWKIYSTDEFSERNIAFTDNVVIGDISSERKHQLNGDADSLRWHDFFWANNRQYREAENGGWFSYKLRINPKESRPYSLVCTYWGDEDARHEFDVLVEGEKIATVNLQRYRHLTYVDDIYPIPETLTHGKKSVTVTFRSTQGKVAGGLYNLRITADEQYR